MSWNQKMAKEAYQSDEYVELRRGKTGGWIRAIFIGDDPDNCHVVCRPKLSPGEKLVDRNGDQITVVGPTGSGTDEWTYKTYSVKVEIYYDSRGTQKEDS